MKDTNLVLTVIALALALAGGIIAAVGRAWAVVLVAAAVVILILIDLL
jgi:hypothetical protein